MVAQERQLQNRARKLAEGMKDAELNGTGDEAWI